MAPAPREYGTFSMSAFSLSRSNSIVPYAVVDRLGCADPTANAFLRHLTFNGRSAYTVRTYGRGLSHFGTWCTHRQLPLANVTTADIQAYIADYRWSSGRELAAATTNHRLSLLSAFFHFLIESANGTSAWGGKTNPVPSLSADLSRQMPMRKRAIRSRASLRRRLPKRPATQLSADEIDSIYGAARSWRDRAILKLLEWSGQRIGDWHPVHGRHGLLGLRSCDIDPVARTVTVLLKGVRDEHVVPVAEPFWPLYQCYLADERGSVPHQAAWIAQRKGRGRPLSYATFETMLRVLRKRSGVPQLTAHAYRHTFAQNLLESTDSLAIVQAFLGHSSPETTAALYARISFSRLVEAIRALEARGTTAHSPEAGSGTGYAFDYDAKTISELELLTREPRYG